MMNSFANTPMKPFFYCQWIPLSLVSLSPFISLLPYYPFFFHSSRYIILFSHPYKPHPPHENCLPHLLCLHLVIERRRPSHRGF